MADKQFRVGGTQSAPADWVLPATTEIVPKIVYAKFDGTGAVASYVPCLRIISDAGVVAAECVLTTTLAAGGSADCTWFPWWRGVSATKAPSPNPLGTLWAWYDFSDSSTLTVDGSSRIVAILDKTGNGHDLSQPTAANRPAQTTVNGLNAANCVRTRPDFLYGGPWSDAIPQPFTVCAVWSQSVGATSNYYPGAVGSINALDGSLLMQVDQNGHMFLQSAGSSIVTFGHDSPFTQTLVTAIVDGGSSSLRVNGVASLGNLTGTPMGSIALGVGHSPEQPGTTSGLNGQVCEVLYYTTHLSSTQLAAVEAYLKAKWGTP